MSPPCFLVALSILLAGGTLGCASAGGGSTGLALPLDVQAEQLAARLRSEAPAERSGVVVQLAFGEEADLDLYVTDPLQDTVYFARHETRAGGRIAADVRCDTKGPRIEEVRFDAPPPGRYRVGIDYPRRCDGAPAPAAYALAVYADGKSHSVQGSVALERFQVVVLEFDVQEGAGR